MLPYKMATIALILIANGVEELEVVTLYDILTRAGIRVYLTGLEDRHTIKTRQGLRLKPSYELSEIDKKMFDVVILPGGEGAAAAFSKSQYVGSILKKQFDSGRLLAVMCASPLALKKHKIGYGRNLTSYPAMKPDLEDQYKYIEKDVVVDDNLITSRGPGTASTFAFTIVQELLGKTAAKELSKGMLF